MGFSRLYARKLVILIAAIGITVLPSFVYGLGLGAIKLNSSLSEILNAEIDLISATPNDVSDLKVKLASREAFLRAGIDRTGLLNSLRFAVKRNDNGKYFIKITSRQPIREPFLNFLLEVNWKNGRMLREYTMLIDPPGRRVQQTQQSTIQAPQTMEVETAPASAEPEASPFKEEIVPVAEEPVIVEPKKADPVDAANDAYINDKELFPHRPVDDVEAPKEMETNVEVVQDPIIAETIPEPEPIIPESTPEPIIPETIPEAVKADEPLIVDEPLMADDSKGVSGEVLSKHSQSGQVIEEKEFAANEDKMSAEDTFGEGELFPTIPLTEYDESKSIEYDEEPVPAPMDVADSGESLDPLPQDEQQPMDMEKGNLDYGITKKSDNLWTIANKMKGDDASVYQVMMALLKSNPKAFTEGNIHRLKVGQVLRIDDPGLITAISQEQAAQDYMSQTEAWDAYRQQVAAAAEEQPLSTGQIDSEPANNIAEAPSGELTLSAPEGEDISASSTPSQDATSQEIVDLRNELNRVNQESNAERGKNSALNSRLRELEAELESMQRSLSVRNDEFAALQQQAAKSSEAPAPSEPAVAQVMPEPVADEPPAPQLEDEPVPTPELVAEEPVTQMEEPAPVAEAPMETEAPAPVPEVEPQAEVPTQPSTSLVDTILGTISGILMPILGSSLLVFVGIPVLIIVLVLIVIMMIRKRSSAKDNFQESILSGAAPVDDEPVMSVGSQNSSETSSFLSDFAISGVGAIQTEDSEVDPLTEADVFMAYGRYEAAEERLLEAITSDPERVELKVKLLEVYNTNKNQTAFESTAEDLYATLGDSAATDNNWQKVVVMGKQIAPNNPIFSSSPTISAETTESVLGEMEENLSNVSMSSSQVMDIGLETGVFSADELSPSAETETDMGSLDFNLGDDSPVTSDEETHDNISAPDGLDFSLDMDTGEDADDDLTKSMAIDLNDMGTSEDDEPTASMAIDLDGLDLDSTSAQLDTGSLDFNIDEAASDLDLTTDSSDDSMDLNLDAADAMDMSVSTNTDEVGTKLDLAKAYIDMGDSSGAKSILDEVLEEGSDDQKQEAEQLISQLS